MAVNRGPPPGLGNRVILRLLPAAPDLARFVSLQQPHFHAEPSTVPRPGPREDPPTANGAGPRSCRLPRKSRRHRSNSNDQSADNKSLGSRAAGPGGSAMLQGLCYQSGHRGWGGWGAGSHQPRGQRTQGLGPCPDRGARGRQKGRKQERGQRAHGQQAAAAPVPDDAECAGKVFERRGEACA